MFGKRSLVVRKYPNGPWVPIIRYRILGFTVDTPRVFLRFYRFFDNSIGVYKGTLSLEDFKKASELSDFFANTPSGKALGKKFKYILSMENEILLYYKTHVFENKLDLERFITKTAN